MLEKMTIKKNVFAVFLSEYITLPWDRHNTTEEEHDTLFLLLGPPFSFWYKSSLFWKETEKTSSDIKSCLPFFYSQSLCF